MHSWRPLLKEGCCRSRRVCNRCNRAWDLPCSEGLICCPSVIFQTTLILLPVIQTLFPHRILEFRFTRGLEVFWSTPLPLHRRKLRFVPSYLRWRVGAPFIQLLHTASISLSYFTFNSITLNTCWNFLVYTNNIFPSVMNPNSTDSICSLQIASFYSWFFSFFLCLK